MTNEEWLKQASAEELADFIINTCVIYKNGDSVYIVADALRLATESKKSYITKNAVVYWLKEKHDAMLQR